MDPRRHLEESCARHGVPPEVGERLMPLVRRAARAAPEARRRLLDLVDATLARDAEELSRAARTDDAYLRALASVLHRWNGSEG